MVRWFLLGLASGWPGLILWATLVLWVLGWIDGDF